MKKRFEIRTIGFAVNDSATPRMVESIVKRDTLSSGRELEAFISIVETLDVGEGIECFCYTGEEFKITRLPNFDDELAK